MFAVKRGNITKFGSRRLMACVQEGEGLESGAETYWASPLADPLRAAPRLPPHVGTRGRCHDRRGVDSGLSQNPHAHEL